MNTEKTILSVSQLNRRAKQLLETHLPLIWVSGEISNLVKHSSGHWYFSLKDAHAQVRCAMFRNANQRVRFHVESGQQVVLRVRVSLFESRGEYQLIAEHLDLAGTGLLQQQYEALKAKLRQEGLFEESRKQSLPEFPQHIGVITSPTGAAIHDIISVLKRRYPIAPVTLFPVSVQGEQATPDIINALTKAQTFNRCDVLIIGRGGGSIEDLWAFNNEALARAIAACRIPIISAVGHEMDFTIADFVADQRAPTPSASAEIITPDISEWFQLLDYYQERLVYLYRSNIQAKQQTLQSLSQRLRHPGERIQLQRQQLNYVKQALYQTVTSRIEKEKHTFEQKQLRLQLFHPCDRIQKERSSLSLLVQRLYQAANTQLEKQQQRLAQQASLLSAISPLNVLARGYSLSLQKNGELIKQSQQVKIGDEITTTLASGSIESVIKKVSL